VGEILQLRRGNQAVDSARAAVPAADMRSDTTAGRPNAASVDPVCGMTVQAAGARYTSAYDGKTFLFCGIGCKERFDREPERYAVPSSATASAEGRKARSPRL
jgi:YHS domain-containing protein